MHHPYFPAGFTASAAFPCRQHLPQNHSPDREASSMHAFQITEDTGLCADMGSGPAQRSRKEKWRQEDTWEDALAQLALQSSGVYDRASTHLADVFRMLETPFQLCTCPGQGFPWSWSLCQPDPVGVFSSWMEATSTKKKKKSRERSSCIVWTGSSVRENAKGSLLLSSLTLLPSCYSIGLTSGLCCPIHSLLFISFSSLCTSYSMTLKKDFTPTFFLPMFPNRCPG